MHQPTGVLPIYPLREFPRAVRGRKKEDEEKGAVSIKQHMEGIKEQREKYEEEQRDSKDIFR